MSYLTKRLREQWEPGGDIYAACDRIEQLEAAAGNAASILSRHLSWQFSDQEGHRKLREARDGLVKLLGVNSSLTKTEAKP